MFLRIPTIKIQDVQSLIVNLDGRAESSEEAAVFVRQLINFSSQRLANQTSARALNQPELEHLATILTKLPDSTKAANTKNNFFLAELCSLFGKDNLEHYKLSKYTKSSIKPLSKNKFAGAVVEQKDSKVKGEVRKIKFPPRQVSIDDLDENGRLKVTFQGKQEDIREKIIDQIKLRLREGIKAGRISKKELQEILGDKPTCGVIYHTENGKCHIYWVYKGEQQPYIDRTGEQVPEGSLLGKGAKASAKILQHEESDIWHALKIKIIDQGKDSKEDTEFEMASRVPDRLAKHRLERISHSKNFKQEEIVQTWVPSEELYHVLKFQRKRQLPPLFFVEIVTKIIQKVIELHEAGFIHRDIKIENIMIFLAMLKFIDYGFTKMLNGQQSVDANCNDRTPDYTDPDMLINKRQDNSYPYTKKTDYYCLGLVIAECLGLWMYNNRLKMLYVASQSDDRFRLNQIIANEEERKAVLAQLRSLTAQSPAARPDDLKACQAFFQQLFEKMRKETVITACVIDVEEFLQAVPDQRQRLIRHAKQFNQLYFVEYRHDAKKHSQKDLISLFKMFEDHYLYCDQVVRLERENLCDLRNLLNLATVERDPGKKFEFTLVTGRTFLKTEQQTLSEQNLNLVSISAENANRLQAASRACPPILEITEEATPLPVFEL